VRKGGKPFHGHGALSERVTGRGSPLPDLAGRAERTRMPDLHRAVTDRHTWPRGSDHCAQRRL
jgi:hypothetical protein